MDNSKLLSALLEGGMMRYDYYPSGRTLVKVADQGVVTVEGVKYSVVHTRTTETDSNDPLCDSTFKWKCTEIV